MAIKFSQFVVKTSSSDLSHIVGYNGVDNIQITPTNFLNSALTGTAGQVLFYDTTGVTGDNDLYWDNSNKRLGVGTTSPGEQLEVHGNIKARFPANGTIGQIKLGNLSNIYADNGDLQIRNNATGLVKVTSGGNVGIGTTSPSEKLVVDGNIKVGDSQKFIAGDGNDLTIQHNGTVSAINNAVGNIQIYQNANDGDIEFFSDDGSGGVTEYFRVDGGDVRTIVSKPFRFIDSIAVEFGTGLDMQLYHSGGEGTFFNYTGNLRFIQGQDDGDITFSSDDGSGGVTEYFRLDGSIASGGITYTVFPDNSRLVLGDGTDFRLYHDGSNSYIRNYTGDLIIQQEVDDGDIVFKSDNGSGGTATYFAIDGGGTDINFFKDTHHIDSVIAKFGSESTGDLHIYHNGSNSYIENFTGDLVISNTANDQDVRFFCDDGSGGVTEYFRLDGGTERIESSKSFRFADGQRVQFGASSDMQIYHDGSNSFIDDSGTGDLRIRSNFVTIEKYNNGEIMASFNDDNAVSLYFNNSKKLETTITGIKISGVSEYADNTAAIAGGLTTGDVYRTGDLLKIVH